MQIPKKTWDKYIKQLSSLNFAAGALIEDYIEKNGIENRKALTDYAYGVIQKYGNGSAALSAVMYDALASIEGAKVAPAELAELPDYEEVAKTIYGTLKTSANTSELSSAASRLVKRAGADTTLKNAKRDGAQFAWVPAGDTCPFCLALASNGWQYMSKEAMKGGHAEHIHANCDCTYAVRFDNETTVAGYDPNKYKAMYDEAEGSTPTEKINSLRRIHYEENKDKINAQKREAYAKRTQTEEKKLRGLSAGEKSSSEIPKHEAPELINTLLDGQDRREVLLHYEEQIKDEPIENAIVITKDGEIYRCRGDLNGVYPDEDLGNKLIGADVTHNHPVGSTNEYTFSKRDTGLFEEYQLNRLRGVDNLYRYEMNRDSKDIDKQIGVEGVDEKSARHFAVLGFAEKHGYGYRRTKR